MITKDEMLKRFGPGTGTVMLLLDAFDAMRGECDTAQQTLRSSRTHGGCHEDMMAEVARTAEQSVRAEKAEAERDVLRDANATLSFNAARLACDIDVLLDDRTRAERDRDALQTKVERLTSALRDIADSEDKRGVPSTRHSGKQRARHALAVSKDGEK